MRYAICLLLAGCATSNEWAHSSKDFTQWKGDATECARFFGTSDREIDRCMATKGWKRAVRP